MAEDDRVKQACAYLRLLLLRPGEYRSRWTHTVPAMDGVRLPAPGARTAPGRDAESSRIDYPAVAAVLRGGEPGPWHISVDTVHRALTGVELSRETLERFIDAFGFTNRHANRLREVLRGTAATRVITGDAVRPTELYRAGGQPGYETLALHEVHTLGPDGRPAEHQTIQVIRSTTDRLESYPYRFDTNELTVDVTRGGQVGRHVYRVSDSLYAVDILLTRPLARGESSLMQYHTTFFYHSQPAAEFRRGLARPTRDVSIWVTFHPQRLPARVWAASWDGLDQGRILEREQVDLDEQRSVHRRFDVVERAIVGFLWEWS
ncbi:hypothetical protein GCM10023322_40130 [Rugosimonospora acidiphila]|uniref:Uncharacterized protein n=1 Tax=Rugosimonospora acidiphila TaxID=556531 RepID=A0ABP9RXD2_9ACTN